MGETGKELGLDETYIPRSYIEQVRWQSARPSASYPSQDSTTAKLMGEMPSSECEE